MIPKPDQYSFVVDPELFGDATSNPTLRFQRLEFRQEDGRHRRSGKFVHVELSRETAMQLLGILKAYQKSMNLPDAPELGKLANIPPMKDRN